MSPLPITLTAKPGTSISTVLRVRNPGTVDETIKISLKSVSQKGLNGNIDITNFSKDDPLPTWVHFQSTTVNAPPGEWINIPMTIDVPSDAAYGYYFSVNFQLANASQHSKGNGASITGAADIFVLLNAQAPGEITKANIVSFSVAHETYEFLPVSFNIRVHNSGNIDVAPHGNIFIYSGSKQIDTVDVNDNLNSVLPGSNKLYTASWSDGFPVYQDVLDANGQTINNGHGQPVTKLKWNLNNASKLRFGHYTAKLVIIYNNGTADIPLTATASFWVIPWRIIAVFVFIIGLIAVLSFYVVTLRRKLKKVNPKNNYRAVR